MYLDFFRVAIGNERFASFAKLDSVGGKSAASGVG